MDNSKTVRYISHVNIDKFSVIKRCKSGLFWDRAKVEESDTHDEYQMIEFAFLFTEKKHEQLTALAKTLKAYHHPTVIPLVGISAINSKKKPIPMIFYPNFDYKSLRSIGLQPLNDLHANNEDVKKYLFFLSLAAGLNSLHENGIVHGMLTDDFVFVDKKFNPYIFLPGFYHIYNIDMKPKEIAHDIDLVDLQFLTPEYIKNGKLSPKSDVYQFGLLFMRVMTTKYLYGLVRENDSMVKMILNGSKPEVTGKFSPMFKAFFDKCTDINPDKRPTMRDIISTFLHRAWVPKDIDQDEFYAVQNRLLPENLVLNEVERLRYDIDDGNTDAMVELASILIKNKRSGLKTGEIDEAIKLLKAAINKKNYEAMVKYGELLEEGIGVEKNKEMALSFYKKAAKNKNKGGVYHCALAISDEKERAENLLIAAKMESPEACYQYGECLLTGNGVEPDINEAIHFFEMASKLGNTDAMFTKGMLLRSGELGENRIPEGNMDILKAAKNNHTLAQYEFGHLNIQSDNIEDATFAFLCLRTASLKGIAQATFDYAIALLNGYGTPRKAEEGEAILKKLDLPESYYVLSKYYENGTFGEDKTKEQSLNYLKIAAEKGYIPANVKIGLKMINDGNNLIGIEKIKDAIQKGSDKAMLLYADFLAKGEIIPKDIKKAMKYYEQLIKQKNAKAHIRYAEIYSMPDTEFFDQSKATQYFHEGGKLGSVESLFNYGKRLYEGIGIETNVVEAENIIKSAAEKKHADAAYYIANLISEGKATTTKDFLYYLKIAADNGNSRAQFKYGAMLQQGMNGLSVNIEEAAKYYKLAAENGDIRAQFSYASCLQAGAGVTANLPLAFQYFKKSAKQGLANSQYSLGFSFEFGRGCKVDKKKALKYYMMAAKQNFQQAIERLRKGS